MKSLSAFYKSFIPAVIVILCLPMSSVAHHGPNNNPAMYLAENMLHLEGVVSRVFWRNPHPRIMMIVTDEQGIEKEWELELGRSVTGYGQAGIGSDLVAVGDTIKAAGVVSRRNTSSIGVQNLLLANGQEMVNRLSDNNPPIWSEEILEVNRSGPTPEEARAAQETADGLFRVWGRRTGPRPNPEQYAGLLTDAGKAIYENYDYAFDNPELSCQSGLASNMFDPTPMQIIDNGDHIVIYTEEYDLRRTVYMTDNHPGPASSNVGFSTGKWDGDTLVVQTSQIDWPTFDPYGSPQSLEMTYLETFRVADDDSRLNYKLVANDPVYYTGPIELERAWLWQPGTKVSPFDCAAEVE